MTPPSWPEELLGAPEVPVPDIEWSEVRARTGLEFPADYREFAALYPALIIDEFLRIRHPAGPPDFDLMESWGWFDLRHSWGIFDICWHWGPAEEIIEFDPVTTRSRTLAPTGGENVFPWGISDIGPVFGFWLVEDDPSDWTVMLVGQFMQWRYRGSLTEFLPDVLSGRVNCPLLPQDWPDPLAGCAVEQLLG
ncbi:hypothetical protein amrb99_21420 [Actinomadura sp. RB99]|uniref:hypothetical protein n=1 Tax=Actinomadura sp. RB99 TaxID=2691577 RepID=UPI00168705D5|nr:hypothetical protein [Actinomadura sp. RB99]MBD2893221.1 hypothetical protein [Actinomadura sp. RB99]